MAELGEGGVQTLSKKDDIIYEQPLIAQYNITLGVKSKGIKVENSTKVKHNIENISQ